MNPQCLICMWGQNARCKMRECLLTDIPLTDNCFGFIPLPESVGYGE